MSTWKDREKVGNMIEDCARGNLPIDDALDIIESLVNESTPINTPTSKEHHEFCSGTHESFECPMLDTLPTPTTDSKNSSEKCEVAIAWIENVIENAESLAILGSPEDASNLRNNVIFPLGKALEALNSSEHD